LKSFGDSNEGRVLREEVKPEDEREEEGVETAGGVEIEVTSRYF
jgi:hypothetical protein